MLSRSCSRNPSWLSFVVVILSLRVRPLHIDMSICPGIYLIGCLTIVADSSTTPGCPVFEPKVGEAKMEGRQMRSWEFKRHQSPSL
ncbi:hypothetical protein V8F20_006840 [Naviculisporaceae sp. PSN 640]